jgi:hypothetical protein
MTDPESGKPAEESVVPTTDPSQTSDSQPSGSQDVDAIVKGVLSHPDFQKATQSVKDKRIAEIQTVQGEQGSEIARLAQALGHTPEEVKKAQTQIAIEDMVAQYQSGTLPPPGQVPDQPSPGSGVDLAKARTSILQQTGLDENTPGLDDYLAGLNWNDPVDATLKAQTWANEQKANIKQPAPADTAPQGGGAPDTSLSSEEAEVLGVRLTELQRDPSKNKEERAEILEKLKRRRT